MKILEHWGLPPELVEKVMSVHAEHRLRAHYISVHKKKMQQTLNLIENDNIFLKRRLGWQSEIHYWFWTKWCKDHECWIKYTGQRAGLPAVDHMVHARRYARGRFAGGDSKWPPLRIASWH